MGSNNANNLPSKGQKKHMDPYDFNHINNLIFHNRKSHDSQACGGAKVKGVEERVGVVEDSVNSTG